MSHSFVNPYVFAVGLVEQLIHWCAIIVYVLNYVLARKFPFAKC